jgi:hypothetical protein
MAGLLQANWRAAADRRLVAGSLALTLFFGAGLYGLAKIFPPVPDTAQLIPTQGWGASASVAPDQVNAAFDDTILTGWRPKGRLPIGTTFNIDLNRLYRLDHLLLAQRADRITAWASVSLEISSDGVTWTLPPNLQTHSPEARILEYDFDPSVVRYARFSLLSKTGAAGWAIDEIYAYGGPVP